MNMMQQTLEMRGMSRKEITDYLSSICNIEDGLFEWQGCRVDVCPETTIALGSINITSTKIAFEGEKNSVESLIALLRLRFLSAGG